MQFKRRRIAQNSLWRKYDSFPAYKVKVARASRKKIRKRTYDLRYMRIRIFVLRKFVKRTEKITSSLVFVCFRFTEISYFLNFPSNKNVRKQHLSANAYSCVNMKFSYTIAVRKDGIFYVVCYENKQFFTSGQVNFSLTVFKQRDEICNVVLHS